MKKLDHKHKKSIDRAICLLSVAMKRQDVPKYKREFERDIKHLCEIALHVDDQINRPIFDKLADAVRQFSV